MNKVFTVLLVLVAVTSITANVLLMQRYSSQRPLMHVGGDTIRIKEYRDRMDYEHGKSVLNKMAYTLLIRGAAKKAGVLPTEADITARIENIKRRTPDLVEEAFGDPEKMKQFRNDLSTNVSLENLAVKDVVVSEAEVRAFYARNRRLFELPDQTRTSLVIARSQTDANTAASLLKEKSMSLMVIARQPRLSVVGHRGFQPDWKSVPPALQNELAARVARTPLHGVVTVPIGDVFFVARVEGRGAAGVQPFEQVKATAERLAKVEKSPSRQTVLARLYKEGNVSFEMSQYAAYFNDVENLPGEDSPEKATRPAGDADKPAGGGNASAAARSGRGADGLAAR